MEWFDIDNAWILWLALALVLGAIETLTVDFMFIMLAGGSVAGALVALAGGPVAAQVIVAVAVAGALVGVVRPMATRRMLAGSDSPMGAEAYVGRDAIVIETVSTHDGRVKLAGEVWSARAEPGADPIGPGSAVRVASIRGATVIVKPVPGTGTNLR